MNADKIAAYLQSLATLWMHEALVRTNPNDLERTALAARDNPTAETLGDVARAAESKAKALEHEAGLLRDVAAKARTATEA